MEVVAEGERELYSIVMIGIKHFSYHAVCTVRQSFLMYLSKKLESNVASEVSANI
jgi:hypothetical protein